MLHLDNVTVLIALIVVTTVPVSSVAMKNIKLLLVDPRHDTVGAHSNYIPIGIGYIGAYLKSKIQNFNLQLELSTKPNETFDHYLSDVPSFVFSVRWYSWTIGLSEDDQMVLAREKFYNHVNFSWTNYKG